MGRATSWLKGLFGTKKDRDKKGNSSFRQSTVGLCNKSTTIPLNCTPAEATWLRSCHRGSQKEQNKHGMAVAAATAAAADRAVAAAQAAVTVVRLTGGQSKGSRKITAAIKIQSVFRGHLARKALRALQGLVKLQAIVRGYLVRKQVAATLHCMQALVRVQSNILARKTRRFYNAQLDARKSMVNPLISNSSNEYKRSIHSRRLSTSFESPKIMEADRVRHRSRSRRTNTWMPDFGEDLFGPSSFSPLPGRTPAPLLMPQSRDIRDVMRFECQGFIEAQVSSSLRFANSYGCDGSVTPASSFCVESYFRNTVNHQSYMANTHSFEAKLRSKSAPKQMPEPGPKARTPHREIREPRNSLDGVRLRRSEEVSRKS